MAFTLSRWRLNEASWIPTETKGSLLKLLLFRQVCLCMAKMVISASYIQCEGLVPCTEKLDGGVAQKLNGGAANIFQIGACGWDL